MARETADPPRRDPDGGPAQARAAETARPSDRTMACPSSRSGPMCVCVQLVVAGAWGSSPDGRGFPAFAPVAQQAERPPRKRKVAGSCPARGSKRLMV